MDLERRQMLLKTYLWSWKAGDRGKAENTMQRFLTQGAGAVLGFHSPFHQKANFPHFPFCLSGLLYKIPCPGLWLCIQRACAGREHQGARLTLQQEQRSNCGKVTTDTQPRDWMYQLSWWTAWIWAIIPCSLWINTLNHPNFNSEKEIRAARINYLSMHIAQRMLCSIVV